jgi:hypothetical protein
VSYPYRRQKTHIQESNTNCEQLGCYTPHTHTQTPTHSTSHTTKPYSILPRAWALSQDVNSSLIRLISCRTPHCSRILPKTRAFRCFQRDHATRMTKVSNFLMSEAVTRSLAESHQGSKLMSSCGSCRANPTSARQPCRTCLGKTHWQNICSTLCSSCNQVKQALGRS